jgi:hypothetical protein
MSTLEERIATALSEDIASGDVEALISETEAAVAAADADAQAERAKALDPIASLDVTKARQRMEDAAFTRDRLRTVLPSLHGRLKQVQAAEYRAQWEPEYERVKAVRDALAIEMGEVYPAAVAQLADLFQRAAECDKECSHINGSAPSGDHRRLLNVELTARGVKALLQPDVWITEMLRLPLFQRDTGDPIYAWPAAPTASQAFARTMLANPNFMRGPSAAVTPEQIKVRNDRLAEDSQRVGAFYAAQEREREARNAREAAAAQEYEAAERNRRLGRE